MGWCTLIPTRYISETSPEQTICHDGNIALRFREQLRMTNHSNLTSAEVLRQIPRKYSDGQSHVGKKKVSLNMTSQPHRYNDYLHPKYSLPPVKLDVGDCMWEYEQLLKTPGRAVRTNCASTLR
ncbi:hypothetical protein KIN20_017461 [Parelaphostrongylus tenuis]|uniref:Uncharacterized protein n=1 Tax=Parelaphostrongylus tenuis TaxID=148309 RepID=A0AAD5N0W0_PARTN|nr:hypothetical protein KIN20_017461 [Parelaphostrongylus tenuis]